MKKESIKIAETTLLIAEKKSWNSLDFDEIIKRGKIVKICLKININSKKDLLININNFFDYKITKLSRKIEKSNKKDMFFEIIMMRFDVLQSYRKAILNIFDSFKKNPQELVFLLPSFIESMILMTNLINLKTFGLKGNLKIKGLLIVYFSSFLIWRKEDNDSLEKTMTSLDIYLDRVNKVLRIF